MVRNLAAIGLLSALALAACSTTPEKPVDPNLFPTNYRKEILDTLKNTLTVNTNVRDAYISDPVLTPVGKEQRYTVCVRSNSRDAERQYMGIKERIAYFYAGTLNQLIDAQPGQCANSAYKPFPELEHLCQAKKCD